MEEKALVERIERPEAEEARKNEEKIKKFLKKDVKKTKDRKGKIKFFKEKMHETAYKKYLRDFYNWYKKSILNKYSLTDSYEDFKKAFEKMCERNRKKKLKLKMIKRTSRTSEGIGKLKVGGVGGVEHLAGDHLGAAAVHLERTDRRH